MGEAAPALTGIELVLNRYRPLRPLGSGGSGSVWLARDERTGLDVALKIVAREGKAAVRAEREAKTAAHLRHPACLRAYGFGHDSRHVYIAYEFVPGQTYREALRAGELTDDDAIEACAQVCDGLAHAHAAGILHRDIKPSNVLLADGDRVSARVLDFGLAQMADAETLTEAGDVPGTLAYISPERLAGGGATPAADVWAVGVMLWEALAGRHPFWRGSMLETARAIEAGARPLGELRPDLPKPLLRVVDGSLSTNPARRPSARELADALRGVANSAVPRPGIKLPTRIEPGQARHRRPCGAPRRLDLGRAAVLSRPAGRSLLALVALAATLLRERVGIAFALAVPFFPLGNISAGLALLYAALAAGWLARDLAGASRDAALRRRAAARADRRARPPAARRRCASARRPLRMLTVVLGVLTAAIGAGIRHASLPLVGGPAPLGLGVRRRARPVRRRRLARRRSRCAPGAPARDLRPRARRARPPVRARTRPLGGRRARRGDDRAHRRRRPERRRAPAPPRRLGDRRRVHSASRACLGGTLSGG